MGTWQIVHVGHLRDLSNWCRSDELLLLLATHLASTVLLVLRVLVLSLGLLFTVKHRKLLLELVVLHAKLTADRDQAAQAVNVVLVLLVDLLVDLQSLVEQIHASVATGDHKLPFDLLRLDLTGALEVLDSLLKHILLSMVHTQARDHINLRRVVPVALLIEMDSLELILLLLVQIAHLGEDLRVARHFRDQYVVPFESFTAHSDQLINVRDLIEHFIAIRDDGVEFFEGLQALVVVAEALVNQAQVIDGFDTISLDTDCLKEELLCTIEFLVHEESVSLVDESL